ncbi:MAG: radical SAM protein [Anaeromyxobacteraceae bacterium]|nr:radical SAM protein [Anaeromyxobacteraceae bacterium]
MNRLAVMPRCQAPCPSCAACQPGAPAPLEAVLAHAGEAELVLGGGDVTRWPHLAALLAVNARRPTPQRLWAEAPAASFTAEVLAGLAAGGLHGVVVQIEAVGAAMRAALRVGDGEAAVAEAERAGLATQLRVCARPRTFPAVAPLARRLAPRLVWLELVRQDLGGPPVPIWPAALTRLLLLSPNVRLSGHRQAGRGYLPPCALPEAWAARPEAFRATLREPGPPNRALPACERCALAARCRFDDPAALAPEALAEVRPVVAARLPWDREGRAQAAVPPAIVARRAPTPLACTAPWTTMEVVDPDGRVRQCCSTWTRGHRASVVEGSLRELWNGPGYRAARRQLASGRPEPLCLPICSRLHDGRLAEARFAIQEGTAPFVANQLLLAEDLAERREVLRGLPLHLAICPSTACNYDCIMCELGRSPVRVLPDAVWEELPELMPTLRSLTLLGGEPLAHPRTMRFLREFDVARWPDCAVDFVTNGSLLDEAALRSMARCTLGDVTVSLNAGTAEVYERVQRGAAFSTVLGNLDALLRFRAGHHRWFGVTLSFVVQPASSGTLRAFGELAHVRGLRIRLMAMNPEGIAGIDFYLDEEKVRAVVADLDAFEGWAAPLRPEWLGEIRAARAAVLEEAARRRRTSPAEEAALLAERAGGAPPGA